MRRVQVKQALVGQGMYREQESKHLEWPDHTPVISALLRVAKPPLAVLPHSQLDCSVEGSRGQAFTCSLALSSS